MQFEQAVTMYQRQLQPLGESDARYERAGIMLAGGELEFAMNDLTLAIALVERVMHTLNAPDQWSIFLHQYAELYAQAAITEVRRNQESQASSILSSFSHIAGRDEIIQYIKAYEESVLTAGDELSEDEARANNELVKRLRALRKSL